MRDWRATETIKVAELFLARAQAESQLAQDFCSGIPLSNGAAQPIEWGNPLTTDSIFKLSVASYDSGLAIATGTDNESVRIARALRIGKARALVALRRWNEAAALVAGIPSNYSYDHTFLATSGSNAIWGQATSGRRYLVGDSVEGNARNLLVRNQLPFFSSRDPRVPSAYTVTVRQGRPDTTKSQDGLTNSRTTTLWARESPVAVFNGIDARMVEAEARLRAQDGPGMMAILNALRTAPQRVGGATTPAVMPALVDPGTQVGRETLFFREKAFWTFGRGQRLGDMRRMIRDYLRQATDVFPEGPHYRTGTYGTDINMPVPQEEENNPNFDRSTCSQTAA
jgi:hypothetical protein